MQIPGLPSLVFLACLLGLLPWAAVRSARRLALARSGAPGAVLPSREGIWAGTILVQGFLLAIAWLTARRFDYRIFALSSFGAREILASCAALAIYFALRFIARVIRSEDELRRMTVYFLAPQSPREQALWVGAVLLASVAEEAAYRGVGMAILTYSLGNPWIAAILCSIAFALAHWTQGWKSALVIFAMALVMHGLVAVTQSLVYAMIVHAWYDLVAGEQIRREAARFRPAVAA